MKVVKVLSSKGINIESAAVYIAETRKKHILSLKLKILRRL